MFQSNACNLQCQVIILVVDGKDYEIQVILLVCRVDLCRRTKRVVCFKRVSAPFVGFRQEVVQLRVPVSLGYDLLGALNRGGVMAGLDVCKRKVEAGLVRVRVSFPGPLKLARACLVPSQLRQHESRFKVSLRIRTLETFQGFRRSRSFSGFKAAPGEVEQRRRVLEEQVFAPEVVPDGGLELAIGKMDLAEREVSQRIVGREFEGFLEVNFRVLNTVESELVDRKVLQSGIKLGVQRNRFHEVRIGLFQFPGSREGDAQQIVGRDVGGRRRETLFEQPRRLVELPCRQVGLRLLVDGLGLSGP